VVRDSEPTADVEVPHWFRRVLGQPQREVDGLLLGLAQDVGPQVLRTREDVEAEKVQAAVGELLQELRDALSVDAELLRPASHPHAGTLDREVGVHPHRDAGTDTQPLTGLDHASRLGLRLQLHGDAGGDRLAQFRLGLPRTGEADLPRRHRGV
jgi:hypothetical protein